ncbi:MAG: tetratricopeptide repeat protein [Helicobacter sp.]|uniref:tetratricopeptide repeat protein n=1 Tax=Helicobacter sp. TaxID=218 RepID=UPI002A9088B0|nr:tetratricopeptide repeat protein [Helicobacter sp.]MDY5950486.1 tetratricopeptide repeat protein [Helicobacter sp.]
MMKKSFMVFAIISLFGILHIGILHAKSYWGQSNSYYKPNFYGQNSYQNSYYDDQYNAQADYDSAYNLYKRGNLEAALPIFARLCEQDNYIACLSAGIVQGKLLDSLDSDKRFSRSERKRKRAEYYNAMMAFYTKACNGGNYDACNNLAFYEHSTKAEREKEKKEEENARIENNRAMELYAKSCKAGNKEACQNLGVIYSGNLEDKNGQSTNLMQAQNYYGRSCNMGDNVACFNLGVLRYNYAKTTSDYAQAIHYFNQACGGDYPAACLNLGIIYERGVTQDVNEDVANAMQYYTKACYLQNAEACTYLAKLANKRKKMQ